MGIAKFAALHENKVEKWKNTEKSLDFWVNTVRWRTKSKG
jgi:hypothetical protein